MKHEGWTDLGQRWLDAGAPTGEVFATCLKGQDMSTEVTEADRDAVAAFHKESLKALFDTTDEEIDAGINRAHELLCQAFARHRASATHEERKRIIAQGCMHTRKRDDPSSTKRPDLDAWQEAQGEWFDDTLLEVVAEYAAWRDDKEQQVKVCKP